MVFPWINEIRTYSMNSKHLHIKNVLPHINRSNNIITGGSKLVLELVAAEELVDVHQLVAVLAEVQVLLVPVVQIHVEIGSVEE